MKSAKILEDKMMGSFVMEDQIVLFSHFLVCAQRKKNLEAHSALIWCTRKDEKLTQEVCLPK